MNAEVLAKSLLPQTVILQLIPKHAHCRFEHVVDACYVVLFCRGASTLRSVVTRREKEHLSSRWNIRICNFTHSLYFSQFDCHLRLLIFAEIFCVWGCQNLQFCFCLCTDYSINDQFLFLSLNCCNFLSGLPVSIFILSVPVNARAPQASLFRK